MHDLTIPTVFFAPYYRKDLPNKDAELSSVHVLIM